MWWQNVFEVDWSECIMQKHTLSLPLSARWNSSVKHNNTHNYNTIYIIVLGIMCTGRGCGQLLKRKMERNRGCKLCVMLSDVLQNITFKFVQCAIIEPKYWVLIFIKISLNFKCVLLIFLKHYFGINRMISNLLSWWTSVNLQMRRELIRTARHQQLNENELIRSGDFHQPKMLLCVCDQVKLNIRSRWNKSPKFYLKQNTREIS